MKKQAEEQERKELRHGYTTGACAAAATKAALLSLITGQAVHEVEIVLPVGQMASFSVDQAQLREGEAECSVIKDAGDDPDATHGARIVSTVTWSEEPGIRLDGGPGVGRVTKPGLPVPVGEAAINPVPRKMIRETVREVLSSFAIKRGVQVKISVPDGEEIAKKTLNERLGIVGGISILGTRGIVVPFSTAAYRASVAQAIQVARANGCRHLVLTTGGSSEKAAMKMYPELREEAFIQMGDFVGFALKHAKRAGVSKVTLVGMMGKFSKVAQGVMMVHSKSAPVDFDFLARIAEKAGAPPALAAQVREANNATHAGQLMEEAGHDRFFTLLCEQICRQCLLQVEGGIRIETILVKMKGAELGRAEMSGEKDEGDWHRR
ncbi:MULTISPECIES: cobalt-precorrin-5B (C(1))-methyltransferase [Thermoactinomyces]|uniref:Cobalt-precorrin-5B C(1)-methyltransferase n=1 Tax=Thermoactinomyces daqus TaxID=1329516 RepID=A0A7W1XCG8_9BACL|nr:MULTISPECIES: cobalt-precorrin-5B (C(1))-methyltransferase [Thermoactinomyces]MBA4544105.1 cobalt-precorrin-5B (C(1))-methyltransferase [Thermoactinomyces daqus]MBH8599342.1 cobalt-precorrin-5B (C(1))-methyltransferase [Thermoactinomyces sp. CICC 10523]MBH8605302.1 cobalt-precorrin-5B (C(1))-methyltransferase [Thermoactinomyces sp. CICC 10522]MBH8608213.1 cobalt-precorrin-5B (C(1))-methyltransferase [Thermoactinomyces sp. CICC 10521]